MYLSCFLYNILNLNPLFWRFKIVTEVERIEKFVAVQLERKRVQNLRVRCLGVFRPIQGSHRDKKSCKGS